MLDFILVLISLTRTLPQVTATVRAMWIETWFK